MPFSGMKVIKIENYKVKFQAFKGLNVGEGKSVWDCSFISVSRKEHKNEKRWNILKYYRQDKKNGLGPGYQEYIEDITCPRVDMNFIFEWSTRYRVEHEKIKFISLSGYVMFCLLYKHQWNTKPACFQRRDLLCNHNDGDLFTCEDMKFS